MKKLFVFCLAAFALTQVQAQTAPDSIPVETSKKKPNLSGRPNDHFMVQFGMVNYGGVPDSMKTSGFSRFFNFYVMFDKPFRNNKNFSLGFGAGIGSDNYFYKNTYVDLKSNATELPFTNTAATNHYKKFKVTALYLDVPLELRYISNENNSDRSFKAAIGAKFGLLLKAYSKGKDLVDASGNSIYNKNYIVKENGKGHISSSRIAFTGRIGYGHVTLTGAWQVSNFLKENSGPEIRPYQIGITLSGL